jgi:ferredoxin
MKIAKVNIVTYSPTRTSFKIAENIADGFGLGKDVCIDLTYIAEGTEHTFNPDDLVIIAAPVYGGRLAPKAVERLAGIRGNSTPVILIVLYGNREFEDALLELDNIALEAGFAVVGAAAFIGEHSFSSAAMPVAHGRPDADDLALAREFGGRLRTCMMNAVSAGSVSMPPLPGNAPYKDGVSPIPFSPQVDADACTLCGMCVSQCPTGAITMDESIQFDVARCTLCCACVKICPEEALSISGTPALVKMQWLYENCSGRKEPDLFMPVV